MPPCPHHRPVSPENPACAWCDRHRINLDPSGRLCRRCAGDANFRATLERRTAMRDGPDACETTTHCTVFDTLTDPEQCRQCADDPALRAHLYGQWLARQRSANQPPPDACPHRGETLRVERRGCCGGRASLLRILRCALHGETHAGLCANCAARPTPPLPEQ